MTERRSENVRIRSLKTLIAEREASSHTSAAERLQLETPTHTPDHSMRNRPEGRRNGMLVLAPSQRISGSAAEEVKSNVANFTSEPHMTRERMSKMAEEVILARIDSLAPDKIADLADMIIPARVNHSLQEFSEIQVSRAVTQIAPVKVAEVVNELVPDMLASAVRDMTRDEVDAHLPEAMNDALEETVAYLIRQELSGELGISVTEKIRLLIRAEIKRATEQAQL